MRIRTVLAVALLLPSLADAQGRRPRAGGTTPGRPVPLGAQPEVIARSSAIQRSRYSIETYPLISRVLALGFSAGPSSSWTSFGAGTRLDYRLTRYLSGTMDLTSSFTGGPATTETAELGIRLGEHYWEHRLRPFADARIGYEHASDGYLASTELGIGPASGLASVSRYSRGFGGIVGVGVDYSLTNTFALTTGVSAMRSNMTAYRYSGISIPTGDDSFRMTTYRFTVGLKYNPVRMLRSTNEQMPR